MDWKSWITGCKYSHKCVRSTPCSLPVSVSFSSMVSTVLVHLWTSALLGLSSYFFYYFTLCVLLNRGGLCGDFLRLQFLVFAPAEFSSKGAVFPPIWGKETNGTVLRLLINWLQPFVFKMFVSKMVAWFCHTGWELDLWNSSSRKEITLLLAILFINYL